MKTSYRSEKLEEAFAALSANYRGTDIDLYAVCRDRRAKSPVATGDFMNSIGVPTHAGAHHGHPTFTLFKYHDVKSVLQDSATFNSRFMAKGFGSFFSADGLVITAMDGQAHRKARGLLQPVFSPDAVLPWRAAIEHQIRDEFILPLVPDKRADLLDFGLYFPIRVIYGLIGFPDEELGNFYEYAAMGLTVLAGPKIDPVEEAASRERAMKATNTLYETVMALVKRRRAEGAPGDDLVCRLLRAEFEGRKLSDHEITTFARSMVAAGGETTTRTFSSIMTLLLQRPALVERVRNDRSLVSKLIDEGVRFEPVSTVKVRQAVRDVEIRGVQIPKDAMVQCVVASANRDEEVFDNSDAFDIDRRQKPSFTFGFGPHMCIGQYLAKMELSIAINAVLDLFPNIRLDPERPAPVIAGSMLRGASSVPVIWD